MDQSASFHQRTLFRIGAVLATLLLLGLGAGWQQRSMAAQREALVAELAADHAAYLALDDRREVLYGQAQPGNAWEAYAKAIGLAADPAMPLREDRLEEALRGSHTPSDAELAAWHEPLQALRSGTHCQNARSLIDLRAGYDAALPNVRATLDLGHAAVVTARHALASGAARAVLGDLTPVLAQPFAQLLQTLLALLLLLLQTRFAALRQRALTALATLRHRHRTEPTHRQNRQQSHVRASLAALVTRARRRSPRTVADRGGRTPADQSIGIGRKSIASTEARW